MQNITSPCHADAYYLLGACYTMGHGVARDDAEANKLFRMAAAQGSDKVRFRLDWSMYLGEGVGHYGVKAVQGFRLAEAFDWFLEGAQHGDAGAQNNLGG